MRRSYLIAIVLLGAAIIVFAILFLIVRNPYPTINPPAAASTPSQPTAPPTADKSSARDLITVRQTPTLGATVGVDGIRLVFLDLPTSTLRVTEYDGTGEQSLSDAFVGVTAARLSPGRDKALIQVTNPDGPDVITLVYDLRTREPVRLEDGIQTLAWSPDGAAVVYYVARKGAAPALKTISSSGANPQTLRNKFTLVDPVIAWYDATHVAFWQKPNSARQSPIESISTDGQEAFELAASAGAQQALFAPDGKHVLISTNDPASGKPTLQLGDLATRTVAALPLVTWIDKCTWTADGSRALCFAPRSLPSGFTYPNDDHGLTYRDELWTITTSNGQVQRVYQVSDGIPDATAPFVAGDLSRLNFLDRSRGALVSLDLAGKVVPSAAGANNSANNSANNATSNAAANAPAPTNTNGGGITY